jgi:hypothetical protein
MVAKKQNKCVISRRRGSIIGNDEIIHYTLEKKKKTNTIIFLLT